MVFLIGKLSNQRVHVFSYNYQRDESPEERMATNGRIEKDKTNSGDTYRMQQESAIKQVTTFYTGLKV